MLKQFENDVPHYVFCPAGWESSQNHTTDVAKHLWKEVRAWVEKHHMLPVNEIAEVMEVLQGAHAILRHTVYRASE